MTENTIRAALINIIRANRQKMSRAQRSKDVKPQRWLYPYATESRYAATIRTWLRPMRDYVRSYLKDNHEAVLRGDSVDDNILALRLDAVPGKSFRIMIDSLNGWLGQYVPNDNDAISASPIYMGLGKIADSVFDFNETQFEKGAKSVLGVEFPVGENWWSDAREMWAYQNYLMISDDMYKYVHDINGLVERAVTTGQTVKELSKQIQALDDKILKSRANFIARDQMGKLNGQITQARMESAGLTMYIWETSGDERVRGNPAGRYPDAHPSHYLMDGLLCQWGDSTVYSEDGGKTWIDRPSGAVPLHPGMDYQCRCTAAAYWEELVMEADEQIDLLAGTSDNIPSATYQGLNIMKPQSVKTKDEILKQQAEAREAKRIADNAKKARAAADEQYPNEKWKSVEDGIYLSPRRPIGKNSSYATELRDAQILRDLGSTVYLTPEVRSNPNKKYDAIVNGIMMEFKNMHGASLRTLKDHFLNSRQQAPNVFINLEESPLTKHEIIKTLYAARNSVDYGRKNKHKGGRIILKINGQKNLIYLNVDNLKI